jgi:hypothetical protein
MCPLHERGLIDIMEGKTSELTCTRSTPGPQFLYAAEAKQTIYRVNLLTEEQTFHKMPDYQFKEECR